MIHCECIPWDYPIRYDDQTSNEMMICDFYGNSCFNSYIESGRAEGCKKDCVPGCNEIKYTLTTEREPIQWESICSYDPNDTEVQLDLFDIELSSYIRSSTYSARSEIIRFQEALIDSKDTNSFMFRYCKEKIMYDIAMVEVIMDSPTVIKYIQTYKATITDKLANFGKNIIYVFILLRI